MYFSVIIPCYNKEDFIGNTIESVINQGFSDYEIIIVDDGSTDKSVEIIQKYISPKIKLITQKNGGVSSARNTGIDHAQGDFIAFLDADDYWSKDYLKFAFELIKNNKGYGLYCMKYSRVSENKINEANFYNIPNEDNKVYPIKDYFKKSALGDVISWTSAVIIPSYIFDSEIKFPLNIQRGEDRYVWGKIALNYDVVLLNKVLAFYNVHDAGLTSGNNIDTSWLFEDYFKKTHPSQYRYRPLSHIEMYLHSRKINLLLPLFKCKNYKEMLLILIESIKYIPLYKKVMLNIGSIIRWKMK